MNQKTAHNKIIKNTRVDALIVSTYILIAVAVTGAALTGTMVDYFTSDIAERLINQIEAETIDTIKFGLVLRSPVHQAQNVTAAPVLEWYPITGADSYLVQIAKEATFTNVIFNRATTTNSIQVSPALNHNTAYFWRVQAVAGQTVGSWSEVRSFTTGVSTLPSTKFQAGDKVEVIWSKMRLREGPGTGAPEITILVRGQQGVVLSHQDNGIHRDGHYWWHVEFGGQKGLVTEGGIKKKGIIIVTFPDSNIEAAVREALDKPTGDITTADMRTLTDLDAEERGIANLIGLEHAVNLIDLNLNFNQINGLTPLVDNIGLGQGDEIWLRGNPLNLIRGSQNARDIEALRTRGVIVHAGEIKESVLFSQYPHGHGFINRGTLRDSLSPMCKLRIFEHIFDLTGVDVETLEKQISVANFGFGGNCFGITVSALMEFAYPDRDQVIESLLRKYKKDYIYYLYRGEFVWNANRNIVNRSLLKHIIAFQISWYGIPPEEQIEGIENVLNTLKNELPRGIQRHILYVSGMLNGAFTGHAVVPYRIETIRINEKYKVYVYEPNYPGQSRPVIFNRQGGYWMWEYTIQDAVWPIVPRVIWSGPKNNPLGDNSLLLVPISVIHNEGNRLRLPGTRGIEEATIFLSGEANLLLIDTEGRMAGLKNGVFYEEIPGVEIIIPIGVLPGEESEWQPAFYISAPQNLTYVIQGIADKDEEISLVKFGKDYFIDFNSVIEPGTESKIDISADGANIFISDHNKKYDLVLNKNVEGISKTLSLTDVPVLDETVHQLIIDWDVLAQDRKEAVIIEIDSEGDGIFEETIKGKAGETFDSIERGQNSKVEFPDKRDFKCVFRAFNLICASINPTNILLFTTNMLKIINSI